MNRPIHGFPTSGTNPILESGVYALKVDSNGVIRAVVNILDAKGLTDPELITKYSATVIFRGTIPKTTGDLLWHLNSVVVDLNHSEELHEHIELALQFVATAGLYEAIGVHVSNEIKDAVTVCKNLLETSYLTDRLEMQAGEINSW